MNKLYSFLCFGGAVSTILISVGILESMCLILQKIYSDCRGGNGKLNHKSYFHEHGIPLGIYLGFFFFFPVVLVFELRAYRLRCSASPI
jgi:hypothetical protein